MVLVVGLFLITLAIFFILSKVPTMSFVIFILSAIHTAQHSYFSYSLSLTVVFSYFTIFSTPTGLQI
jgi:hypothetical protein